MIKKQLVITAAILVLAAAGCKDKPKETPSAAVPQQTKSGQNSTVTSPPQPLVAGHKGKVVATMDGGAYTFMQVEENGRKKWVGAKQIKINVGDEVEFPEAPFVEKFKSKALNRTFDKVYFVSQLRVNGK